MIDLDKERKTLDREITFFHFKKAASRITRCIRRAKETNNKFFLNYFLAQKFILKEDFNKAIEYFNRALKIRPNDGCTYNDKAICLAELGKYSRSLDCFNAGLRKDPNCVVLYHNKGWLLNSTGKHGQAIVCFRKALELDPDRVESIYSLADSYFWLGKAALARKYFRQALIRLKGKCRYMYKQAEKRLNDLT